MTEDIEEKDVQSEELIRAEKLIYEGNHDAALELMKNFEEKGRISLSEKLSCQLLKCELFLQQSSFEKVLKLAEEIYEESSRLGMKLLSFDGISYRVEALIGLGRPLDNIFEILKQGEEILKILKKKSSKEYIQREARLFWLKGNCYEAKYENESSKLALECFEDSLSLHKIIDNKRGIIQTLVSHAHLLAISVGKLDLALKITKEALKLAEETKNKYITGKAIFNLMGISFFRGEYDKAILYAKKCLRLFNEINNKTWESRLLSSIGTSYGCKGEYKLALEFMERALTIQEKLRRVIPKCTTLYNITEVAIDMGNIELAQGYLKQFEQLNKQSESRYVDLGFRSCKALILKTSLRPTDRAKAIIIFKEMIDEAGDELGFFDDFLVLCDLLLSELEMTNNLKIMDEIEFYIARMVRMAERSKSFWLLGEIYYLQAKLKLLTLNLNESQEILTLAQETAEKHSMNRLAEKISREQEVLLSQTNKWLTLKDSKKETIALANLTPLKEQISYMLKKRRILNL